MGHSWYFPEFFSQICVLDTRRLTIKSWISIMAHQYKPVTSRGLQLEKSETSEEFLLVETGDFTKVVFFFGWFHLGAFRNVTNVEFQVENGWVSGVPGFPWTQSPPSQPNEGSSLKWKNLLGHLSRRLPGESRIFWPRDFCTVNGKEIPRWSLKYSSWNFNCPHFTDLNNLEMLDKLDSFQNSSLQDGFDCIQYQTFQPFG